MGDCHIGYMEHVKVVTHGVPESEPRKVRQMSCGRYDAKVRGKAKRVHKRDLRQSLQIDRGATATRGKRQIQSVVVGRAEVK